MGRQLSGTGQYYEVSRVLSGMPFSIATWFNPDVTNAYDTLVGVGWASTPTMKRLDAAGDVAGDPLRATRGGSGGEASTTSGFTSGSWQHAVGVWYSSSDRRVYLNGGNKGTSSAADNATASAVDVYRIGCWPLGTPGTALLYDGAIAEVAIWDTDLTDAEVLSLYSGGAGGYGLSADQIQAGHLIHYWKLLDGDGNIDYAGISDLSAYGTPTNSSTHPNIDYGGGGGAVASLRGGFQRAFCGGFVN